MFGTGHSTSPILAFPGLSLSGASLMSNQTFTGQTPHSQPSTPTPSSRYSKQPQDHLSLRSPSPAHSFPLFGEFFPLFSATPPLGLEGAIESSQGRGSPYRPSFASSLHILIAGPCQLLLSQFTCSFPLPSVSHSSRVISCPHVYPGS